MRMFSKRDLSVGIFLLKGIEIDCVMCVCVGGWWGGGTGGKGGGVLYVREGEREIDYFFITKNTRLPPFF